MIKAYPAIPGTIDQSLVGVGPSVVDDEPLKPLPPSAFDEPALSRQDWHQSLNTALMTPASSVLPQAKQDHTLVSTGPCGVIFCPPTPKVMTRPHSHGF